MGNYARPDSTELSIGEQFENALRSVFRVQCTKVNNKAGTAMDKYEGTDFTYMDMRIDATVHLSGKKWMPYITDTNIEVIPGQTLKMGIRHGNSHNGYTEFPEPVVVIGWDCPNGHVYDMYEKQMTYVLVHNIDDIVNTAVDAYEDYVTEDAEDRKNLFSEPLRKNPQYRPPKKLGQHYKDLNDIQEQIMPYKEAVTQQLEI